MANKERVRNLYKALLGREPDKNGLSYWTRVAENKGFNEVIKGFSKSKEVREKFEGKSPQEIIRTIYLNAFGREPDASGMKFWFDVAKTKSSDPAYLADAITQGARGSDILRLKSPVKKVPDFTSQKIKLPNLITYDQYINKLKGETTEKIPGETLLTATSETTISPQEEDEKAKKIKLALMAGLGLTILALILKRR